MSPSSSPQNRLEIAAAPFASTSAIPYDSVLAPAPTSGRLGVPIGSSEEEVYDEDTPISIDMSEETLAARRYKASHARTTRRPAISRRRPSRGAADESGHIALNSEIAPSSRPSGRRQLAGQIQIQPMPFTRDAHSPGPRSAQSFESGSTTMTNYGFGLVEATTSPITPTASTFSCFDTVTPQAAPTKLSSHDPNPNPPPRPMPHPVFDENDLPSRPTEQFASTASTASAAAPLTQQVTMRMEMPPAIPVSATPHKGYVPTLPSPLSNSCVSDSEEVGPWTIYASNASPVSHARSQFPFPPSPSRTPYPLSASSASSTNAISAPCSPFSNHSPVPDAGAFLSQSPPTSIPRRLQAMPSPPLRAERGRSRSGGLYGSPPHEQSSSYSASHHWNGDSTSSSRSTSLSRQNGAPLTPPESTASSRHSIMTSADAWHDVLGEAANIGYASMDYNAPAGAAAIALAATATKRSIAADDLMSLEGDTPAPRRQSMPLGATNSMSGGTPTDGGKRVNNCDLMAGSGGGHFGPATREKLASAISRFIGNVPLSADDDIVHLVEYGAMNSRSASLFPAVISHLVTRHEALRKAKGLPMNDDDALSFQVTHADKLDGDFRPLAQLLENTSDSYLNAHWLTEHRPSLENRVFSSFATRPFGSKILPRNSVSFGFSAMALHWLSTDRKYRMAPATIAHGELMAFLSARATEFKVGGLFAMAYIARSEDKASGLNRGPSAAASLGAPRPTMSKISSSPETVVTTSTDGQTPSRSPEISRPTLRERSASTPLVPTARKDIWTMFTGLLGKAIQRLVSTQLLKPAVARQLLALPIHARTPRQTKAVLRSMQHAWEIESDETIKLSHPAWAGLEHQTISPASYADQTIQLLKVFWESEMRAVLREALLSRAACEFTLDCLWNVVKEKVDEEGPQPLDLEVQITLLRRKADAT